METTTELKHEHEASSTLPSESELTSEENGTTTSRKRELPEDHHEADSEPNLKHPKLEHGSPEPENENEIGNGEGGIEGEDGEDGGDGDSQGDGSPSRKDNKRNMMIRRTPRKRLIWTQELHTMFIETVNRLGNKAVPTTILQEMNVQGLTRENIASHLQKYRLQLKKLQKLREGPKDHEGAAFTDPMMQQYKAGVGSSVRAQILDTKHHQVLQQLLIPGTNLPAGVHVSLEDLAQASNEAQTHAIAANAAGGAAGGDSNDPNHQHQNDGSQLTYTVPVSHLPFLFQQAAGQSVPYVLPQYQYRVPGAVEPLYYLQPYDGGTASYLAKLVPGTTIIPVSQLVTATGSPATSQVSAIASSPTGASNASSSTAPSNPSAGTGTNPSSSPSSALAGPPQSQIPTES